MSLVYVAQALMHLLAVFIHQAKQHARHVYGPLPVFIAIGTELEKGA
ncbi:MAG: hypothetical protein JW395_3105 [Nitrospira sp.]|nr:hypothetical protein [Nitrospira sp.]